MMKLLVVNLGLLTAFLSGASPAGAQETVVVHIETYCWDASANNNTFVCEEGDREWGRATNIPHPPLEAAQPVTRNYTTEHTVNETDEIRCYDSVKDRPGYEGIQKSDTFISCGVVADWFAYPVAEGQVRAGFGDPLETGTLSDSLREGGEPDVKWGNIVAEVTSVSCSCMARVPVPPI